MEPTVYKSVNRWYNINIDDNKKKKKEEIIMLTLLIILTIILNFVQRNNIKKLIEKDDVAAKMELVKLGRRGCFITKKNKNMVFNYLAEKNLEVNNF